MQGDDMNTLKPGRITNPLNGLCNRIVATVRRVFDGCYVRRENAALTLTTDEAVPEGATFVSAVVTSTEFVGVTISPTACNCNCIEGELITHYSVTYAIGDGLAVVAAHVAERKSVNLRLPTVTGIAYEIEAYSVFNTRSGVFVNPNTLSLNGCLLQLIRVTAPVDVLIPAYGYCCYPPCGDNICPGESVQSIFPLMEDD